MPTVRPALFSLRHGAENSLATPLPPIYRYLSMYYSYLIDKFPVFSCIYNRNKYFYCLLFVLLPPTLFSSFCLFASFRLFFSFRPFALFVFFVFLPFYLFLYSTLCFLLYVLSPLSPIKIFVPIFFFGFYHVFFMIFDFSLCHLFYCVYAFKKNCAI